jgi:methyl-accepting chemotaxis protein
MTTEKPLKPLQQLLDVARAITNGDFSKEVKIDTEGIIAELAQEINNTVHNLRNAMPTISATTDSAPNLAYSAQSIAELMNDSTKVVLDSSDKIIVACEELEKKELDNDTLAQVKSIKNFTMDIISAQSYQDSARQKLDKMENDLIFLRDSLIEALIVMNIKVNGQPEQYQDRQLQLKNVQDPKNEGQKQDLVDQLLAEFGL